MFRLEVDEKMDGNNNRIGSRIITAQEFSLSRKFYFIESIKRWGIILAMVN